MNAELARLAIVYAHLIACCVAIGMILTHDVAMVRQLLRGQSSVDDYRIRMLHCIVSWALAALWFTGLTIVAMDVSERGVDYLANPKLQAKIAIVYLLTMNGLVLHQYVLPVMRKAGSLLHMTFKQSMLAIFAGTVSGVSWLYTAMLGVGRALSWKYSLLELTVAYPLLIVSGFFAMVLITDWARHHYMRYTHFTPGMPRLLGAR